MCKESNITAEMAAEDNFRKKLDANTSCLWCPFSGVRPHRKFREKNSRPYKRYRKHMQSLEQAFGVGEQEQDKENENEQENKNKNYGSLVQLKLTTQRGLGVFARRRIEKGDKQLQALLTGFTQRTSASSASFSKVVTELKKKRKGRPHKIKSRLPRKSKQLAARSLSCTEEVTLVELPLLGSATFLNHRCDLHANCRLLPSSHHNEQGNECFFITNTRAVEAGEELVFNYGKQYDLPCDMCALD